MVLLDPPKVDWNMVQGLILFKLEHCEPYMASLDPPKFGLEYGTFIDTI